MKKHFFAILLVVCMMMAVFSVTAFAKEASPRTSDGDLTSTEGVDCTQANCTHVAELDGKHYTTLSAALTAAKNSGGTLTLKKNVNSMSAVAVRQPLTIDLNGNDIAFSSDFGFLVYSNGNLNLTGTGTVTAKYCALYMKGAASNDGTKCVATVGANVTLSAPNAYTAMIYQNGDASYGVDLTVNGTLSEGAAGIFVLGNIKKTDGDIPKITLNETATVEGTGVGIAINGYADVTVDGATVTGSGASGTGIEIRAGKLTVNSGEITGNGTPTEVNPNGSGTTTTGAGIGIAQHGTKLPINVEINGGNISGHTALNQENPEDGSQDDIVKINVTNGEFKVINNGTQAVNSLTNTGFIKGGNFSNSLDNTYLDTALTAELYSIAKNEDAPYSYYKDSSAAIEAATAAGDTEATVNLLNDDADNTKTVTLDANGGQLSVKTIAASADTPITLPTPTRSGYVFQGWFDESGTVAANPYTVTADATLTAQWTYIPPTYTVAVPTTDNGKLSVSPKYAVGGQNVTITVTPDEGYELDSLTVTDAKGNELELKDLGNGKYSFKMPYGKVNVNASFVETEPEPVVDPVKDCDKDGTCPAAKFTDVDRTAWYHDGVHYCISEGLMNGTGATTFEPLATTDRAMLVTILYRLEGEPAVGENQFNDVAADEWYTKAVSWAADNGIVKGYGDGTFGPEDIITREQMATILHRYAAYKGYDVTAKGDLSFTDAEEVSDWAEDAMTWTVGAELINGVGGNKLEPEGDAQRAQIATILYRFCENIVK